MNVGDATRLLEKSRAERRTDISIKQSDQDGLIQRLVKGQIYLTAMVAQITEDNYEDEAVNANLAKAFDLWIRLEKELREAYGYQDCIHGAGASCPVEMVGRCQGC